MKNLKLVFILVFISPLAWASGGADGITFDAELGYPSVTITNPDNTKAGYGGISLMGRLWAPLYSDGSFSTNITAGARYHDLKNSANNGSEIETGNHIGPAVGLALHFAKINFGYEYLMMKARHYYIGDIGKKTEFDYSATSLYGGARIRFGVISFGLSYSYTTGAIAKSETGLSRDSNYTDQTVWLQVTYQTDTSLGEIAGNLAKEK